MAVSKDGDHVPRARSETDPSTHVLTPRLSQILHLAAEGKTDKEIASELMISHQTVESHWKRLRDRFGSSSRVFIVSRSLSETVDKLERELAEARAELDSLRSQLGRANGKLSEETVSEKAAVELRS
ncbi:MAG: hypothetical protein KIT11_06910 [Fimbriimonadaceae bacterium]|nr:hypothetical protein [Fimbriimonadaceae bacterium]QYK56082.1 MAG: hypothetical protein KF733_01100 [Fimbriimonadaceae bacterium]